MNKKGDSDAGDAVLFLIIWHLHTQSDNVLIDYSLAVEMLKHSVELTREICSHHEQLCPEVTLEWITHWTGDVITSTYSL